MPSLLRTLASLILLASVVARADVVEVKEADLRLEDDQYVLNAEFELALSPTVEEALRKGIPLYFVLEFEVNRPRWYWFDERLVSTQVTYRVSFSALTRQFRLSSGLFVQNLATVDDVIRLLSRVRGRPVARQEELPKGSAYEASVRFRLDSAQLPKPLQVSAIAARDWQLQSPWYRWTFEP